MAIKMLLNEFNDVSTLKGWYSSALCNLRVCRSDYWRQHLIICLMK